MSEKRALMVWGGWEGHVPREATELFAPWLAEQGYDVTVSDTLEAYEDYAMLTQLDLVVPVWTQGTITVEQERNLLRAVWSGVGIAGWHGCMADSFRVSTDYQFMVGGQWGRASGELHRARGEYSRNGRPGYRGPGRLQAEHGAVLHARGPGQRGASDHERSRAPTR